MNILSFDIEEWYINLQCKGSEKNNAEYDRYLDAILTILNERRLRATFFCVGEMGRYFPEVIRRIHSQGHEIGCHSNTHSWLNKMTEAECREDTYRAVDSLEQCIGEKVKSYRAPAFSIGENNTWVFQILVENGIERDASVFPLKRDFGGFSVFSQRDTCLVKYNGIVIKEFPVNTARLFGKEVVCSGGGYFRFYPYYFVDAFLKNSQYSMCYFHIGDLQPDIKKVMTKKEYESYFKEKGTMVSRYFRYIKSNIGKERAFEKMSKVLNDKDLNFINIQMADELIDWTNASVVEL